MAKFAIVVDGEVAGVYDIPDNIQNDAAQRIMAAFRSNPIFVETTNFDVAFGWKWDGTSLYFPVE